MKHFLTGALAFAIIIGALAGAYYILRPTAAGAPTLMSDRNPRGNALENVLKDLTARGAQRQEQQSDRITIEAWPVGGQPAEQAAPVAAPANAPLVTEQQQQQLDFAAELAAQEAAEQYLQDRRAAEYAAPVRMTADEAAAEYGRHPCSAPRADPATCNLGIPEATPLNQP